MARSATRSPASRATSATSSRRRWSGLKPGPARFQCPCLARRPRATRSVNVASSNAAICSAASLVMTADSSLLAEEGEQRLVDLVGMGPGDVVRAAVDPYQPDVLDQVGEAVRGGVDGQDTVLGTVHDQHRYVDLGQVTAEVGLPGVHAGVRGVRRRAGRHDEARVPRLIADPGGGELVDVVEVVEELLEVGVPVLDDCGLDVGEDLAVDALGVVVRLQQERWGDAEP